MGNWKRHHHFLVFDKPVDTSSSQQIIWTLVRKHLGYLLLLLPGLFFLVSPLSFTHWAACNSKPLSLSFLYVQRRRRRRRHRSFIEQTSAEVFFFPLPSFFSFSCLPMKPSKFFGVFKNRVVKMVYTHTKCQKYWKQRGSRSSLDIVSKESTVFSLFLSNKSQFRLTPGLCFYTPRGRINRNGSFSGPLNSSRPYNTKLWTRKKQNKSGWVSFCFNKNRWGHGSFLPVSLYSPQ